MGIRATMLLGPVLFCLAPVAALAQTTTSGTVLQEAGGGPVGGFVGVIRKSTVDASPDGEGLEPELLALIVNGSYSVTIDDSDPTYAEFYVFTMSPLHFNKIYFDTFSTFARPYQGRSLRRRDG